MNARDRACLAGRSPHEQHLHRCANAKDGWFPGEARPTGGFRRE